ncbi:hypothetical protein BAY61_12300 [Prauserella marina]|uniref:NAD(P)H dehydrogenase (Quinone) n=1 Tax=Prauserella marina TaxID=530584 RepID=A0A222VP11_9PSEU|nr:NAD(P)H-dependent oxidoreductase [Prauserella marina]ASR35648.1 hypothetical protein BAY61_12300 [Prauserella marina]PWV84481.1 NAD(P)H dehydrogenase (quinone) [Prauserella marina]SDC21415.1 NAD(P)H dehydrogenase (quinone) [Prauserella marina]
MNEPTITGPKILAVVAHPDRQSLTWKITERVGSAITEAGGRFSTLDLYADDFSPAYDNVDRQHFRAAEGLPGDVVAHQALIDEADALVVIFPVFWWSMPGVLKGWFDRVFARDWAYDIAEDGSDHGRLGDRSMHSIAIAGAGQGVYERHGYRDALHAQLTHGIFEYCGVRDPGSHLIFGSENPDKIDEHFAQAGLIGEELVAAANLARTAVAATT